MSPSPTGDASPHPEGGEPAPDTPAEGAGPARKKRGLFGLPRPVVTIGRVLIVALLVEYFVVPQLAGPRKVASLLDQVNPFLLLAGVALEGGALLAYARLTNSVLPPGNSVKFFTIFRIQMTTLSVSHCAPGGSATGTALGYRLLTQNGVQAADAGFVLGAQGIGSAIVLNVILWVSLVVSIPVWGFSPEYLLAALVGGLLLASAALLAYALTFGEERIGKLLETAAAHVPFVDEAALRRWYSQIGESLWDLFSRKDALIGAIAWAVVNWLLDAASLFVFVAAFGHVVNPDGLLVAYGLANVLAAIPITPGGLGVVEAALTTLLVGFGTPRGVATLGVIVYRLFNFWAPIPLGGVAYLSLQASRHQDKLRTRRTLGLEALRVPFTEGLGTEDNGGQPTPGQAPSR